MSELAEKGGALKGCGPVGVAVRRGVATRAPGPGVCTGASPITGFMLFGRATAGRGVPGPAGRGVADAVGRGVGADIGVDERGNEEDTAEVGTGVCIGGSGVEDGAAAAC